jgi:hypothetical protein
MGAVRIIGAYIAAVIVTYGAAAVFYTQQILAKQAAIGAVYTPAQQAETYLANILGLQIYGAVLAVALLIGFIVAAIVKRILKPLAPIAYPLAGAAAVVAAIYFIENTAAAGGAGAIGGARDALGLALQGLAGAFGGFVFALIAVRR